MKKLLALLSLTLALGSAASAVTYTDINDADVRLDANWLLNPFYNPSYTGTFTLANYDPLAEEIISAKVSFNLWDGDIFRETYSLAMSDMAFSGSNFIGSLTFGGAVVGNALFDLSTTGALSYTIMANKGTFWLTEASLTAESALLPTTTASHNVPETSATFALMGVALAGLVGVKRKLRA